MGGLDCVSCVSDSLCICSLVTLVVLCVCSTFYSKRSILRNQPLETQRWIWAEIVGNQPQFLIFTTRELLRPLRNWLAD